MIINRIKKTKDLVYIKERDSTFKYKKPKQKINKKHQCNNAFSNK